MTKCKTCGGEEFIWRGLTGAKTTGDCERIPCPDCRAPEGDPVEGAANLIETWARNAQAEGMPRTAEGRMEIAAALRAHVVGLAAREAPESTHNVSFRVGRNDVTVGKQPGNDTWHWTVWCEDGPGVLGTGTARGMQAAIAAAEEAADE